MKKVDTTNSTSSIEAKRRSAVADHFNYFPKWKN